MKSLTIRQLIDKLIQSAGDLDDPVGVKINQRSFTGDDTLGTVQRVAIVPIHYVDSGDNICIEFSDIKFVDYTHEVRYGPKKFSG